MSYEPVTSYRTSYYYEPVTSYSYSMKVDPCTGCATQVATPQTCYQIKSQCNAVTNYVQRIAYQPVTTYRQSFYYDPVQINPCCPTTAAAPVVMAPPVSTAPPVATEQTYPPPTATTPPLNYGPDNRTMPPGSTSEKLIVPSTARPVNPPVAGFRPDRLASRQSTVNGTIVRSDFQARPGAKIRFVSANGQEFAPVTADSAGRFRVSLASGTYTIYTEDANGRPKAHSDFVVRGDEDRNVTVVAR